MPETGRDITATRIALLELKDEQRLVQEGYSLLDEKRIVLAQEIRRQLARLAELRRECGALENDARARTMAALGRHGLDELSVYPTLSLAADDMSVRRSRLLGLELLAVHVEVSAPPPTRELPVNPTPEARRCAQAYRDWLPRAVEMAACSVNLRRLVQDYVRTERRAKALENVLMPEIESSLKLIEDQLESIDQEEIARLRRHHRAFAS